MRLRLCVALVMLAAPPALHLAHAAEPASMTATADEVRPTVSAGQLDLGSLLVTDVYDIRPLSALSAGVTQSMQDAPLRSRWPRSSLRRDQALVGAAALVAGLLVAPTHNEWPIDEGWIGLGGAAVGAVLLLDSAFGPHWGPPER